ncbi:MAG: glycosyltransferase family 39 protein [Chloroflexi bacterium]|nr:glycosyltransferase family 39 protein [Chloroflexota bacterium]
MDARRNRRTLLLLIAALALAVAGQYYFSQKREFMWDGIALYALAAVCFALVTRRMERQTKNGSFFWKELRGELWAALQRSPARLALALAGLGLSLFVALTAEGRPWTRPFFDLLVLWLIGVALTIGAFVRWRALPERLRHLRETLPRHSLEVALVVLIVALAFFLRAYRLHNIPPFLSGDEASMGLEAIGVLEGERANPFVTGWFSNPMLYFWMQAGFLRLLGVNVAALRLPSAIISALTTLLLYLFARRHYGRGVALIAALFFATYHYAIHFGRLAYNNIWDPFFALGTFYLVSRGIEERSTEAMALGGVWIGSSIYFHAGTRLVLIILFAYLLYLSFQQRGFWREHLPCLIVLGFVALVIALPLLKFYQTHPNDMLAPWRRRAIYPMGWVEQQKQLTGRSEAAILFEQFLKAALAFNYFRDPTFHYRPEIPLLQFVPAILFILGLVYALMHTRRREYFLPAFWLLMVIIFGGMLLENPPSAHRLVLSTAPVSILVALGIVKVCAYLGEGLGGQRLLAGALSAALIALVSYQSLHFYFDVYTAEQMFTDTNTHVADRLGKYLNVLGPEYQAYFFGAPRLYCGHASIPFQSRGVKCTDVVEPLQGPMPFLDPTHNAVFVLVPERQAELEIVRRSYPNGLLREFRDIKGQLLFVAYEVTF